MRGEKVVIVGAGIGGLSAAALLSARGCDVTVIEKEAGLGGKVRQLSPAGRPVDAGPTVFTMRWVFDELFAAAGGDFEREVTLQPLEILARHAWDEDRLDLFADRQRSADSIAALAGPDEARRFGEFCDQAARTYRTLERPFLHDTKTNPVGLTWRIGPSHLTDIASIRPFASLWRTLGRYFHDPRLRQLFGRYATYNGSSPFLAPATLMLIAHVEQAGVWSVDGGMHAIARALAGLAERHGAAFRYGTACAEIETRNRQVSGVRLEDGSAIEADRVVFNGDPSALAIGLLGNTASQAARAVPAPKRSLSAWVWAADVETSGFPLERHNVFFSSDYQREFDEIAQGTPGDPTIYVCAQDRPGHGIGPERLQIIVNAAANGDTHTPSPEEIALCETRMFDRLARSGLTLDRNPERRTLTTPAEFERLFPATGGALYGQATHGWAAAFQRPGARTAIPGLYLAGGATHPGAGVPMAALSGCRAGESVLADCTSTQPSRRAATAGGMSTQSAKTAASA